MKGFPSSPPPERSSRPKGAAFALIAVVATACIVLSTSSSSPASYAYPPFRSSLPTLPHTPATPSPNLLYPTNATLHPLLLFRLRTALTRHIPSHNASLERQLERCPHAAEQANPGTVNENIDFWRDVSTEDLEQARERVLRRVAAAMGLPLEGAAADADGAREEGGRSEAMFGDGRKGIVYTGGNSDTARRILNSLTILRKSLHCDLPVEIWGYESELRKLGWVRRELEALGGVQFRASRFAKESGWDRQYKIKGEAIARSTFSEVLYLDSDNVLARDPTFLFDSAVYRENGIVVWPDFNRDSPANPIWRMTGKSCDPEEWQAESGQLLVSKLARGGLNLAALLAAEAMQLDHKFWFRLSLGDKDTFRYGFYLLDLPLTPAPHYLSAAGGTPLSSPIKGHTYCGHTMLQYGLSSSEWYLPEVQARLDASYIPPADHAPPLFVHANLLKQSGGITNFFKFRYYNYHRGNTFRTIKLATPDRVHEPSSNLLTSDLRFNIFHYRGSCTDLGDSSAPDAEKWNKKGKKIEMQKWEGGRIEVLDWDDSWGGLLRGFEDMFFDAGGLTA